MTLVSPASLFYVLYDGHCATCHTAVRWLLRRRGRERFRFVSLEALRGRPEAEILQRQLGGPLGESIIVLAGDRIYQRSEAVLVLLGALPSPWRCLAWMRWVPRAWRDAVYKWVAANRYRWFGRTEPANVCARLAPAEQALLLNELPQDVSAALIS